MATSDMDSTVDEAEGQALKDAVLIAGPTASGKTVMAVRVALALGGVVINADSMQVYSVLDRLTARPGREELAAAPHFLFGHVDPANDYSTGAWLGDVRRVIADELAGRPAIFVGGTGLYFTALLGGLSDMPRVPDAIRRRWRYRLAEEGPVKLHRILRKEDPSGAMTIMPGDGQRIVRALEVLEASGKPISHWQSKSGQPTVDPRAARRFVLVPDRDWLRERIALRFSAMVEGGALDEVRTLVAMGLPPEKPAMKAIGVRELAAYLEGSLTLDAALEKAVTATRQYAKRQMTWFRNQLGPEWQRVDVPDRLGETVGLP